MEISPQLRKILSVSFSDAKYARHEFFTPEHLLSSALAFDSVHDLLESCGADVATIRDYVNEYIKKNVPVSAVQGNGQIAEPVETQGFQEVMNRAVFHCASSDRQILDITDVLVSMIEEKRNYCAYSLRMGGVDKLRLIEAIGAQKLTDENQFFLDGGDGQQKFMPGMQTGDDARHENPRGTKPTALEKFCVDLTAEAKQGKIDALIGRTDEIDRTIQILCRRTKNNPLYVGDAGVGKTALANGLALRIAQNDVPDAINDFSIYSLDMGLLLAGTKFRGDFEDRLRKITDELMKKKHAILFIDEIHMIMGAGTSGNSTMDAANLLKPVLSSGKIRCIGSTTHEEYAKNFEKDRALARRFQKIDIKEPSPEDTLAILKGLRDKYESYHGVVYSDTALKLAVDLSVQYLPDRRLPDKAIDIIDEAGSYLKIKAKGGFARIRKAPAPESDAAYTQEVSHTNALSKKPVVSTSVIKMVTAKMARVPLESVTSGEKEKLRDLADTMRSEIFGQDEAVAAVTKAVKRARAGFNNPERPEASFLFVGPTGVGKTELARALSRTLGETLLRYDMSEYQEEYTVSRLIGSAPGYVGYEEGGQLTEDVRKNPHSIVLFDEIEKAHPKIYNVLLQVMDYGFLTDNQGRKADFRNCIIIMTSNAGAREMEKSKVGFGAENASDEGDALSEAVEKAFSPEFRNRLDGVIAFSHLGKEIVDDIAKKEVAKLAARLAQKKVKLETTAHAIAYLSEKGYSREFGARNMARTVEEEIASPLTDEVLFGKLSAGGEVHVDVSSGSDGTETLTFDYGKH
ncbi:AAA family ATPase [Treponema sp. Marseille-Q4130]|uniref:AAA family ATPase n=1 Tax=Treponema sp. Marseille-Q4130 TaxID=2766702 RepID=UPI00165276D0|nr:AAA family ATPase [Treponema sp. Marseille-Q4130]MBC6720974.1 AAA family ATPase [Treponema sp. Marseille-Q4130]